MTYHREHMGCIRAAAPPPQPDDTALLRQALEALRQCQFTTPPAQRKIVNAAIAAIRERLK
jgi:DNA-directed RNA polymerase specialized sigma24 family protein